MSFEGLQGIVGTPFNRPFPHLSIDPPPLLGPTSPFQLAVCMGLQQRRLCFSRRSVLRGRAGWRDGGNLGSSSPPWLLPTTAVSVLLHGPLCFAGPLAAHFCFLLFGRAGARLRSPSCLPPCPYISIGMLRRPSAAQPSTGWSGASGPPLALVTYGESACMAWIYTLVDVRGMRAGCG